MMMSLEELRKKREKLQNNSDIIKSNIKKITDETLRVADIAHHSREILDNLDQEFEERTELQNSDIKFLFSAIALQVIRMGIIGYLTKVEPAGSSNEKEKSLHKLQEKILSKFNSNGDSTDKIYYASMEHIITRPGVPYDATATLTNKAIDNLKEKGREWDFDIEDMIPKEKLSLFKGANHRFSTLGHDPLFGLIFGTGNIMTNTITCINTPLIGDKFTVPVLTTNHVVFTSDYKDPRIAVFGSTIAMIKCMVERTETQPEALIASLIKQIIHIGTDLYTPCGIQIPGANLILSNKNVEKITHYVSSGDLFKIGTSAKMAELINTIIATLHTMMYDTSMDISRDVYNVRTKKIIMYSNFIATTSNVIWASAKTGLGDWMAIKDLDLGGLIVTVQRLINDPKYIRKIKEEFVFSNFNKMIQGEKLELENPIWGDFMNTL